MPTGLWSRGVDAGRARLQRTLLSCAPAITIQTKTTFFSNLQPPAGQARGKGQLAQVRGVPGRPPSATQERYYYQYFCCCCLPGSQAHHPHGETESLRGRPLCSPSAVPPLSPALVSGAESLCVVTPAPPLAPPPASRRPQRQIHAQLPAGLPLATLLLLWSA